LKKGISRSLLPLNETYRVKEIKKMTIAARSTRIALALALVLSAFAFLFATNAAAQTGNSRVRVAHMSPDAPAVDVYVNGNKTLSNVAFKAVSDYLSVPAGQYRFEVRPAGAAATDKAVIDATATLAAGKDYTVAATGLLANIGPTVLEDDNAAPAAGKAKVKVVHASPDAPAVDVAVKGGPVLIQNLAFGKASNTLAVDAATYDLEVRAAGTTTVALALNGTNLEAGKVYTVFASGRLANLAPVVTAITPAGSGGGNTGLPSTGLGGASQDSFNFSLIAVLALGVALVASTAVLRRRTIRK
jgi:hypothetical protein